MKLKCISFLFLVATLHAQKPILPDFHADPSTDGPGSKDWTEMKRWHTY
jgi:hypothetical protein